MAYVTLGSGPCPRRISRPRLREHVGRQIGKLARPSRIIWADDLPKTRSGKIMRRLLRDIAEDREPATLPRCVTRRCWRSSSAMPAPAAEGQLDPVGATDAILAVKSLYDELKRTGGRYALVTMCIGGGQGIAAIFEQV